MTAATWGSVTSSNRRIQRRWDSSRASGQSIERGPAAGAGERGDGRTCVRCRDRYRRRPWGDGERVPDRRSWRPRRTCRHQHRRYDTSGDRACAVEGAPGARDHRLRRLVAAHHPLHGDERNRPHAAAHCNVPAPRRARGTRGGAGYESQREGSDRVRMYEGGGIPRSARRPRRGRLDPSPSPGASC